MAATPEPTGKAPKRHSLGWIVLIIVGTMGVLIWQQFSKLTEVDEKDATTVADALQAYREKNGRYPETLQDLVPGQLSVLPEPKRFLMYAPETDGSQCWLMYQLMLDSMNEYDCQARKWGGTDIDLSRAFRHPNRQTLNPTKPQ